VASYGEFVPREKRFDRNQEMFRKVNERIAEVEAHWGGAGNLHVFCECRNVGCGEQLGLSLEEYKRVRTHDGWLIVKQGHAAPEDEVIVERHGVYDIVELGDGEVPDDLAARH
jgi:hypothetical protein